MRARQAQHTLIVRIRVEVGAARCGAPLAAARAGARATKEQKQREKA